VNKRSGPFWDVMEGRAPLPRAAVVPSARRCCRAIRDHETGRLDGLPLPVIVGIHAPIPSPSVKPTA